MLAGQPRRLVHGRAPRRFWLQYRSELLLRLSLGNHRAFIFFYSLAQSGISWAQYLLFRAEPLAPTLEPRHLLFGFSDDEIRVVPRVFVYLLNVLKFNIWVTRNNYRYLQVAPWAVGLIAATRARLSSFLPILARRFISSIRRRYFISQWGASGIIGRYHDSNFHVII